MNIDVKQLRFLLFPPRCAICGEVLPYHEREQILCENCRTHLPFHTEQSCSVCSATLENGICPRCSHHVFLFSRSYSAFRYTKLRRAIYAFKYSGYYKTGKALGILMAEYLRRYHPEVIQELTGIAAVPLYRRKLRRRGFNQAEILARTLSEELSLPYLEGVLLRVRNTKAQSKLHAAQRRVNLKGAFALCNAHRLQGKTILLVDDIFTTGATFQECSKLLLENGAAEVIPFALSTAE